MTVCRAFSAPGKAFVAGGYLVLDPKYSSYVTALSSRMHAIVRQGNENENSSIVLKSPQFKFGEWSYEINFNEYVFAPTELNENRNPFLEATILTVLSYINPKEKFNIEITIFSDPGYHSQSDTTIKTSDNGNCQFLYHSAPIMDVAKTGLGSSAGLVTVVTAALLSFFNGEIDKNVIHNAAQIAHCYAQKKIGSGFDVATAVFGSITYQRFQPQLIDHIFELQHNLDLKNISSVDAYKDELKKLIESEWDFCCESNVLPPGIKLVMGDIKGGSETPKLVSKVLKWKETHKLESDRLYDSLNQSNQDLIKSLNNLNEWYKEDPEKYNTSLEYFKTRSVSLVNSYLSFNTEINKKVGPFVSLIRSIERIRSNLRKLSRFSGAEIEPPSQTILLNNCLTLRGCLGGVVPGAGGYDAICLLVTEDAVTDLIDVTANDERFVNVKWLDLREDDKGLLEVNPNDYYGL